MKLILGAIALLFLCPAYAQSNLDTIWHGRDKGQHFELGMAEGALVSAYLNEPGVFNWKAVSISTATEIIHQVYIIRTNPGKIAVEGLADAIAHGIGSAVGVGLSQNTVVQFRHSHDETHVQVSWKF